MKTNMSHLVSGMHLAAMMAMVASGDVRAQNKDVEGGFHMQPKSVQHPDKASAEIPLVRDAKMPGFIIIEASVNGRKGAFLVDTGATPTVVDKSFAKALGLTLRSMDMKRMATNVRADVLRMARIETLAVGTDVFKQFDVGVHDLSALNQSMEHPIDGIIGMNILGVSGCRIDTGTGRLTLYPAVPTSELARKIAVLIEFVGTDEMFVTAQINGRDVRMKIDTGATASFLGPGDWTAVMASGATPAKVRPKENLATINEVAAGDRKELSTQFKLGYLSSNDFPLVQGDYNLLGMNFLSRSIVTFDPKTQKVYFENIRAGK
jgi:predicted aspartyl protease